MLSFPSYYRTNNPTVSACNTDIQRQWIEGRFGTLQLLLAASSNIWLAACQNGISVTKGTISGLLAAVMACDQHNPLIADIQIYQDRHDKEKLRSRTDALQLRLQLR